MDGMNDSAVLQVDGLCFAYPECEVIRHWSATFPAGVVWVRGDESSGKTTLLRLLAGQLVPQAGRMVLHGRDHLEDRKAWAAAVFWADPRSEAFDTPTARQWLHGLPARYPAWSDAALAAHVAGFSLDEHLDKPFYALSTGSKRKVLLAGALASGAALTLIDEPVGGLDKPSVAYLGQALARAACEPQRVVVVAHYEALPGVPWGAVLDL